MSRYPAPLLFLSLLALAAAGCREGAHGTADPPRPADAADTDKDDGPAGAPSPDVLALARGNNEFAFDLYRRLAKGDGNVVFSPYSISTALAMTYAGARGDTADEMAKTLHFSLPPERLHPAFADLSRRVRSAGRRGGKLLVADSLWGQRGYPLRDDFLRLACDDYDAEAREADFRGDAEGSRQTINRWVGQKTEGMIPELLPPGTLGAGTRLVPVNAVYFRSLWGVPFPADQTNEAPFHTAPGESVRAPLMHLRALLLYYDGDGVQTLELPYKGDRLSMVAVLPRAEDGLAGVVGNLSASRLQGWLKKSREYDVTVTLPRFTADCNFLLGEKLQAMGMPLAFKGSVPGADFSGISDQAVTTDGCLHISEVVHQARVEVNEEGTKAAAATAVVGVVPITTPPPPPPKASFVADHPFLFFIRDRDSGVILFIGRVAKPVG